MDTWAGPAADDSRVENPELLGMYVKLSYNDHSCMCNCPQPCYAAISRDLQLSSLRGDRHCGWQTLALSDGLIEEARDIEGWVYRVGAIYGKSPDCRDRVQDSLCR